MSGASVRVTGMVCGLFMASPSVMVMVAVWLPAARPEISTVTVTGLLSMGLPEAPASGSRDTQSTSHSTAHSSVPLPPFQTSSVCGAGSSPFSTALNSIPSGAKAMAGSSCASEGVGERARAVPQVASMATVTSIVTATLTLLIAYMLVQERAALSPWWPRHRRCP